MKIERGLLFSICLLIPVLLLFPPRAAAVAPPAAPAQLFAEAGKAYESDNFPAAIEKYEALIHTGYGDGVVYYNLGNSYFRSGDLARAVLNYRRAQRIMPRDPELLENLEYCRALVIDEVKASSTPSPVQYVIQNLKRYSLNELTVAASALFFIAMLGAVAAVFIGAPRAKLYIKRMVWLLLLMSLALGAGAGYIVYEDHKTPPAVVLEDRLEVLAGPGEDFSATFILHKGAEATVLRRRGEWRQILFPSAGRGWVHKSAIEKI